MARGSGRGTEVVKALYNVGRSGTGFLMGEGMSEKEADGKQNLIWDMALKGAVRGLLVGMVLGAFATPLLLLFAFYVLDIGGYWFRPTIIEIVLGGVFSGTIFGAVCGAPVGIVIGVIKHFKPAGVQSESAE